MKFAIAILLALWIIVISGYVVSDRRHNYLVDKCENAREMREQCSSSPVTMDEYLQLGDSYGGVLWSGMRSGIAFPSMDDARHWAKWDAICQECERMGY